MSIASRLGKIRNRISGYDFDTSGNPRTFGPSNGGDNMFYKGEKFQQVPTRSRQQLDIMDMISKFASSNIMNKNGEGFGPIRERAIDRHERKTIPYLAERFGASGAQDSSSFRGAIGQSGLELDKELAALEAQYNQQERGLDQQLLGVGLGNQFENVHRPGELNPLIGALAQLLGKL